MCQKREHARESLENLRSELHDLGRQARLTKAERARVSEIRATIRNGENDILRLRWYEHGGDRPVTDGKRERKAEERGQLNAFE